MKKNIKHIAPLSDIELINCYSTVLKELKNRKIIRTKNVIGDLGEKIAIEHYCTAKKLPQLKMLRTGNRNVDASCTSKKRRRYAIKTLTGKTTGAFHGLPPLGSQKIPVKIFDYLIIVKLDQNYGIEQIIEVEWSVFLQFKKWHKTVNAWNISFSKGLIAQSKVIIKSSMGCAIEK